MPYLQIVYRSVAREPLDLLEVGDFLKTTRGRDRHAKVSGMLLYREGRFVHLIEGPGNAVREAFEHACQDARQQDVKIIEECSSDHAVMPAWAMVYLPATGLDDPEQVSAACDFVLDPEQARDICRLFPSAIGQPFLEMLEG